MFFDRNNEKQFQPTFAPDNEPPLSGLWYVRLTQICVFKKSKKGTIYLSWPVEITHTSDEELISGYREIEWMLFFEDDQGLLEILMNQFGLDKPSLEKILSVYFSGSFVDGKEPVVLQDYTHKPLLVEISPGFTPNHRSLRLSK